ncbi:stage II sporulation protein M [Parasphingopyxis marina]|uniref:Stage II sporulation protein M n=1 Tax=Parasphingopyxis marina TaxID=2761622 RepID=A0A842HWR0_9SPHN|nr:stage II sporulation protein M [Parasphingopyxis marina]MBC2776837.1 stage II sporulation protein M [Parasphingopyxis marina]
MERVADQALFSSRTFRAERENDWLQLEELLRRAEAGSVGGLSDEDLLELPVLYRSALSSLSVARETSLDMALVSYLEGLCTRAYFFVYGVRTSFGERMANFFARDWPRSIRALWRETLIALALIVAGAIAAYLLVSNDPNWYNAIIPQELAAERNPAATTEQLRQTLYHDQGRSGLGVFATYLFTHNAQVSIFAFALGFAFGVPTALLMVYNGAMIGAFSALFVSHGLGFELGGWLLIHGSTELFAIGLAGAAGLHIGTKIIFPGMETRLAAARRAGRTAATAMIGVVLMLLVAGLLEGFGRQLIVDDITRYAIAAMMFAFWCAYFYLPRATYGDS